jgi:trk system potassium uptake protein TrkH
VLWFEGALLAALVGFAVARGLIVVAHVRADGVDPAGRVAAAQTYDLVFTVLAGLAGGLVIAPERTGRACCTWRSGRRCCWRGASRR